MNCTATIAIFVLLAVAAHVYAHFTLFYQVIGEDITSFGWRVVVTVTLSPVFLGLQLLLYITCDRLSQLPKPALLLKSASFYGISDIFFTIVATLGQYDFGLAGAFAAVVINMVPHKSRWAKFVASVTVPIVTHILCPILQLLSSDPTGPDNESWDKAGEMYVKLANYLLKLDNKYKAADAYVNAAHCYKMTNLKESIPCLEQSVDIFLGIEMPTMAAIYYQELAELYEQEQNVDQAIVCYEIAANQFQIEEMTTLANHCKQRIAQFAALIEQYPKAIKIYEEIARHSLNDNLLKYEVKEHLLNAGICQLCKGDVVAISNALERYRVLDPTLSEKHEYKLLANLATAVTEKDLVKFNNAVQEFDSVTKLDAWKATLLLRMEESLKAKELEEDGLT